MNRIRFWLVAGLLLFASACTGGNPAEDSIEDQGFKVRERIGAQYIAATEIRIAADGIFPQGYTLEELPRLPLNCHDGGTLYGVSFIVHGTDPNKLDVYFDLMMEYWSMSGYNLVNNNRPDAMFMNASKKFHNGDYLMSIRAGIHGQVSIGNSTPCI